MARLTAAARYGSVVIKYPTRIVLLCIDESAATVTVRCQANIIAIRAYNENNVSIDAGAQRFRLSGTTETDHDKHWLSVGYDDVSRLRLTT